MDAVRRVLERPVTTAWPVHAAREATFIRLARLLNEVCEARLHGFRGPSGPALGPALPDELTAAVLEGIGQIVNSIDAYFARPHVCHTGGRTVWIDDPRFVWKNSEIWIVINRRTEDDSCRVFDNICHLSPQLIAFVRFLALFDRDAIPADVLRRELGWKSDSTRWRVTHELNAQLTERRSVETQVRSRRGDVVLQPGFRKRIAVIEDYPDSAPAQAKGG